MWKPEEIRSRLLASFGGAILCFILIETISDTPLMLPIVVTVYTVCGLVFGIVWPNDGWRLGVYLFGIWPLLFLFSFFLAADLPGNLWANLKDLFEYTAILVGACLGAAGGSMVRGRSRRNSSSSKPSAS